MAQAIQNAGNIQRTYSTSGQPHWQRIILLIVLGYEAAGCLLGGALLTAAPDGRLMDMPVSIMHGTFHDFMLPGLILFALGILNAVAFAAVLRRQHSAWLVACMAMSGLLIWFWVEIAILLRLHWLHIMWGAPVIIGTLATVPLIPSQVRQRILLICGMLASLLYIAINIIVPAQWKEYDIASQTVSELSAVAAPTRMLWQVLCTPYTLLMIAFALGVWRAATGNRRLRIAGGLLLAYAALGIFWPFAPMHLRPVLASGGATFSDTMHISLGAVTEVFYLLALSFAAAALGRKFRLYSILTFIILLVFGAFTFIDAPGVSVNKPTQLIGVWERINIGVFLLWVMVLAWLLLRGMSEKPAHNTNIYQKV